MGVNWDQCRNAVQIPFIAFCFYGAQRFEQLQPTCQQTCAHALEAVNFSKYIARCDAKDLFVLVQTFLESERATGAATGKGAKVIAAKVYMSESG